jgi:DNA-binding NtrC family response regulator
MSLIIGQSEAIERLRRLIARVAPTEAIVLIVGERGTGKELVADAIQRESRRQDRPFVKVNCAALPPELLTSELFGHERGAFTGAHQRSVGVIAAAEGGTLFLDEIGRFSLWGQAMLLRFLEGGEVTPVGSRMTARVDVRLLVATNRDLELASARDEFLPDLYDRLNEVVLEVPPLRERREDIPLLAEYFLAVHARRHGVEVPRMTATALRALLASPWPGNVRELGKAISRAVLFASDGCIRVDDLRLRPSHPNRSHPEVHEAPWPLTLRQREALEIASRHGYVRRGDLITRFGVSRESARHDLTALVDAGLLRQSGRGRGSRYTRVVTDDQV